MGYQVSHFHSLIQDLENKINNCRSIVTAEHYQVLSTDYTNYAVEWRCEERGIFQHRGTLTYFDLLSMTIQSNIFNIKYLILIARLLTRTYRKLALLILVFIFHY